jgi:glycosyltransferase involved in cell wall biosynthesis
VVVSAQPAANVLVAVLARLFSPQTRVVLTYHETTEFYRPVLALINPWCAAGQCAAVVAVSRAVVASLGRVPGAFTRKLHVITNALPPGIEALCDRLARRGAGGGAQGYLGGAAEPEKNVEALIEAAAVEGARFEVVIYGRGPHEGPCAPAPRRWA